MKLKILILTIAAVILLLGFSPWEGAGGVASNGDLPASGFFVATNAFPRNTVVDITNIESGKTTRAIVANTLNNPGLLAVVSREAADLIGMRNGSISRIRLLSPSDPIAYQRFTEGLSQEMPPFDSGNVIKSEDELINEVYGGDTFRPNTQITENLPAQKNEFTGPSYLMEPEWGGTARPDIVDIPRYNETPAGPFQEQTNKPHIVQGEPVRNDPVPGVNANKDEPARQPDPVPGVNTPPVYEEIVKDVPSRIREREPAQITKDVPAHITEQPLQEAGKQTGSYISELPRQEPEKQTGNYISELPRQEPEKQTGSYISELPHDAAVKDVSEFSPVELSQNVVKDVTGFPRDLNLADTAKDLPEYKNGQLAYKDDVVKDVSELSPFILAQDVVKDVSPYPVETSQNTVKDVTEYSTEKSQDDISKSTLVFAPEQEREEIVKAISDFKDGIPNKPDESQPKVALAIEKADYRPPVASDSGWPYGMDPNDIIPGIAAASQDRNANAPVTAPAQPFSVQTIPNLDRGQYYVQLASLPYEMVENTLRQFDPQLYKFHPVVFRDRDNLYSLLIGPLNQGESAAVLARFKSIGYRNAVVRRGG